MKILDPVDPSDFWELLPKLPGITREEGVDAVVVPFTRTRATDLVLFKSMVTMNQILGRPTVFLIETGKMRNHLSMVYPKEEYEAFVGHDFEENLLRDFAVRFSEEEREFTIPEHEGDALKLCREREFWKEYLIPRIERDDDFTLVAGCFEDVRVEGTVSHELLHVAFYADERLRRLVAAFWDTNVTDADKLGIVAELVKEGYEVEKSTTLLHSEFLAYILERTATEELLRFWAPLYAARLRKLLADNGIVLP